MPSAIFQRTIIDIWGAAPAAIEKDDHGSGWCARRRTSRQNSVGWNSDLESTAGEKAVVLHAFSVEEGDFCCSEEVTGSEE